MTGTNGHSHAKKSVNHNGRRYRRRARSGGALPVELDAAELGRLRVAAHHVILAINVAGVAVLFALMVGNLAQLFRDYRQSRTGLETQGANVVGMFVGLAVLPLLVVVFYFSIQFINSGIDSWFSTDVEEGLDDALALSQAALGIADARSPAQRPFSVADRLRDVQSATTDFRAEHVAT